MNYVLLHEQALQLHHENLFMRDLVEKMVVDDAAKENK